MAKLISSMPPEVEQMIRGNAKWRKMNISEYVRFMARQDDYLIQDAKRAVIDKQAELMQRVGRQA